MNSFEILDNGHEYTLRELLKNAERTEKAVLRAGANVMKKSVKKELTNTGLDVYSKNPKYQDRLIDALRVTKPRDGEIKVHILGTRAKKSGTYRLRFFESAKKRYNLTKHGVPLKKKRKVGSLSRFNGFFKRGIDSSSAEVQQKMDQTLQKYIEKIWNG